MRSIVSMLECRYRTRRPCSSRYSLRSSAIFLVSVVTSTRWSRSMRLRDLGEQVVDLALRRADDDLGVDQARRPHDLLDHRGRDLELVGDGVADRNTTWLTRSTNSSNLQRAVVGRRRQPEAVLDELLLAAAVALVLAVELRDGHVALVDDQQVVVGEEVEQGVRRGAGAAAVDRRRVVLDAVAEADLLHHLEVVLRAHAQALGLEQLALLLEVPQPLGQLGLDAHDGGLHALVARHVVGGGVDPQVVEGADLLARGGVDLGDALDLVAEQLDAHGSSARRRDAPRWCRPAPGTAPARGSCRCGRTACRPGGAGTPAGRSGRRPAGRGRSPCTRPASPGRRCTTPRPPRSRRAE